MTTLLKDHAKLMQAIMVSGEISGRKKLQKMIFIAKKVAFPFHDRFSFHFYGPYSEELTTRVEELCNMGFLNEVKEEKGGYYQYRYTPTETGKEFLSVNVVEMPRLQECLVDMNEQNARFLELVSTILYFDNLSKEEVASKICTLKSSQRYAETEIVEAYGYITLLKEKAKLR
jgi:uncharacterized protein YwgA